MKHVWRQLPAADAGATRLQDAAAFCPPAAPLRGQKAAAVAAQQPRRRSLAPLASAWQRAPAAVRAELRVLPQLAGVTPFAQRVVRTFASVKGTPSATDLQQGCMVQVKKEPQPLLVVLSRTDGKQRWWGLDKEGSQQTFCLPDIIHVVGCNKYQWHDIATVEAACASLNCDAEVLKLAWELLSDKQQPSTTAEVCELMLGEVSPAALLAASTALRGDGLLFAQKGPGLWQPNTPAQVTRLEVKAKAEAGQMAIIAGFKDEVRRALELPHGSKPPRDIWRSKPQWSAWVEALEGLALESEASTAAGEDVLRILGQSLARPSVAAATTLIDIGHWSFHQNVPLLRAAIPTAFDAALQSAAEELAERPGSDPDAPNRINLTHLKTFTIDPASTTEIDDALSIEELPGGGHRLWVHIADPTRFVPLGHPLEKEALRRGSTVYFPTGNVPMFPDVLAAGPMSLRQGVESCALSVMAEIGPDGAVVAGEIVPTTVLVTYRLTYDDADDLMRMGLDEERELSMLADIARARLGWRKRNGAIYFVMPEAAVHVEGADVHGGGHDASVRVVVEDERADSVSRMTVQEMMILAGEIAGGIGAEHGLLLPFRSQPSPTLPDPEVLEDIPAGPCRSVAMRSCMPPSTSGLNPAPHAALGLDAYVQMSSPIRRYGDLLAHYHLKAFLRGESPPLGGPEVLRRIETSGAMVRELQRVARESERYWVAHWFATQPAGTLYTGLVLRWLKQELGLVSVLMEGLGLEQPVRVYRDVRVGERIAVQCVAARPREGTLHFKEKAGAGVM